MLVKVRSANPSKSGRTLAERPLLLGLGDIKLHVNFKRPEVRVIGAAVDDVICTVVVLDHKGRHEVRNLLSHAVRHRNISFHPCTSKWVLNFKFSLKNS